MRRLLILIFALAIVWPAIAISPTVTDAEILAAIQRGSKTKNQPHGLNLEDQTVNVLNAISNLNRPTWAWSQGGGFSIAAFTPITWIEQMAANAARDYKEFGLRDVTEDMTRPVLFIVVYGRKGKEGERIFGE